MEAKELRLGNYVNYKYSRSTYMQGIVTGIYNSGKIVIDNKNSVKEENITPIDLSEDIILKCGLECINTNPPQYSNILLGPIFFTEFAFGGITVRRYFGKRGNSYPIITIEYLHELQNLYYVLMGEELEVKL